MILAKSSAEHMMDLIVEVSLFVCIALTVAFADSHCLRRVVNHSDNLVVLDVIAVLAEVGEIFPTHRIVEVPRT